MSCTRILTLVACVVSALATLSRAGLAEDYIHAWQEGQPYGYAVVDPSADEPIQVQIFRGNGNPYRYLSAASIELDMGSGDFGCDNDPLFSGDSWIATADTDETGMTTFEPHGSGCGVWYVLAVGVYEQITVRTPDFSRDGQVDLADFVTFQSYFLQGELCADFDSDGDVDLADHVLFTGYYLNSCN